jgi:ribosome-binding protein aMBF1 (putative translation factor)
MGRTALSPPRAVDNVLKAWGAAIRTARVRRGWRRPDLATKSGISPSTLQSVELGTPGVGVAAYLSAMWALGLLEQLAPVTDTGADASGILLEAQQRKERVRLPKAPDDDF